MSDVVKKIMGKGSSKVKSEPKVNVPKGTTKVPQVKGITVPQVPKGVSFPKLKKK